jgi:Fic family protein
MYVRKEALLSSQIEGTQASLMDVLEYEVKSRESSRHVDAGEVINYIDAMNYGLGRLAKLPVSLRLIKEIHERVLRGVQGPKKPGEFRRSQNWIGPSNCTLANASFVPPPPNEMMDSLSNLEKFIHDRRPMPVLIKLGIVHAQFETIHPFLDGNGRVGRLLITFLLCENKILKKPLLYLSFFFKKNRLEYYDRLQSVRDRGDWEGWMKFFLAGVVEVSEEATNIACKIMRLRERHRELVMKGLGKGATAALKALESLYRTPYVSVAGIAESSDLTISAANVLAGKLCSLSILEEVTGQKRNRYFIYLDYLSLFDDEEYESED